MTVINWADDEKRDGPVEIITMDGAEITRKCYVPWEDRITAARELLGGIDSGLWHAPEEYSPPGANEGLSFVYANKVEIRPHKEQGDGQAELTVHYKSLDYQGGNTFVTEALEPSSMFITLGRRGLNFGSGGSKVSLEANDLQAPAAIICMIDWVYTVHYQTAWSAANFNLVGRVNGAPVTSFALLTTFPAETLLCRNPTARREVTVDGSYSWTITYRFTYMNNGTMAAPKGWNHQIRTDNADGSGLKFERVTNDAGVTIPIYQLDNFSGVIA